MKISNKFILGLGILGFFLFFYIMFLLSGSVLDREEFYARVVVTNRIGVDANDTALVFGGVTPGGSSIKKIFLESDSGKDVKIEIYSEGEISEFLEVSENFFVLSKDEKKEISFIVKIPLETEFGTYEGKVIIIEKNI